MAKSTSALSVLVFYLHSFQVRSLAKVNSKYFADFLQPDGLEKSLCLHGKYVGDFVNQKGCRVLCGDVYILHICVLSKCHSDLYI